MLTCTFLQRSALYSYNNRTTPTLATMIESEINQSTLILFVTTRCTQSINSHANKSLFPADQSEAIDNRSHAFFEAIQHQHEPTIRYLLCFSLLKLLLLAGVEIPRSTSRFAILRIFVGVGKSRSIFRQRTCACGYGVVTFLVCF